MTEFDTQRVSLSTGYALDVVDMGPKDAPALIFLHGFPESHRTWRNQLPEFAKDFRVVAPDQRGYCGSDKPEDAQAYTPDKLTADVFALADALGIERFTVIGHDWGGAIAWSVALTGQAQGNRVERTIIMNAPHPLLFQKAVIDDPEQRAASQYIRAFRDPANDDLIREHGLAALLMKVVKWDRSPMLDDAERDRMLADWAVPGAAFGMLNWYRGAAINVPAIGDEATRPAFLDAAFPKLTMPTLIIWAMDDLALRPSLIDAVGDLVEDLTLVRVPDCGHFVPWEAPRAVNAAMRDFLGVRPVT